MSDPRTPSESSCKDEYDPQALSVDEAQQRIDAALQPLRGTQRLAVRDSLGRVLVQEIIAPFDIPSAANSAMDGYALRAADLDPAPPASLEVIGESYAGRPSTQTIGPRQALRIMTGALLPRGADTVVMQEEVTRNSDRIIVNGRHRRGANVRLAGQDL